MTNEVDPTLQAPTENSTAPATSVEDVGTVAGTETIESIPTSHDSGVQVQPDMPPPIA